MKENQLQEEGPVLQIESFDVLPAGRTKIENQQFNRTIEKILQMEAKTMIRISKADADRWRLTYPNVRTRLVKADQLGRFTFRTLYDGNKDKIGYAIYCLA